MRSFKTKGIVIKRHDVHEADRIIVVYTREFGKLRVKARGVRRITSRRAAHIELLNYGQLTLYKGSQTPVLVEAEVLNSFSEIKHNLRKIGFAYHICELIDGLCPEGQEQREVFYLLKNTLNELTLAEDEESIFIIHDFEVELLTLLGFWHKRAEVSMELDTHQFIEDILERKLKSYRIFSKLHHESLSTS